MRRAQILVIGAGAMLCAGCFNVDGALEDAIDAINSNSAQWQAVVQKLEKDLAANAQSLVLNEVQSVANRTVATAGIELRCDADFVAQRVKQGLQRIQAGLKSRQRPPLIPGFCQADPATLQLDLVRNNRLPALNIYGYDMFDRSAEEPTTTVWIQYGHRPEVDVSAAISRPTHYLMTVNLARISADLTDDATTLVVRDTSGNALSTIGIIPPPPPPMLTKVGVVFDTKDDGKNDDTGVNVLVNDVTRWSFPKTGPGSRGFATYHPEWFVFDAPIPLAEVAGKSLRVCIDPSGHDTWKFYLRFFGTRGDSQGQNYHCEVFPDTQHCYIHEMQGRDGPIELNQDKPCQEWTLP